ncbi:hypothetical protein EXIGLDRAFT_735438 [Exidia glandulosa HHB12029]|uniref:Uncharacterized protein n=1 Tax=Exidia glandulosa HHB12029 TaxID=1314781 RepID=A0A166NIR4_EXIGL|nr:hypothetical protein EXIGLDRAFT_735438 [Exidia glandulosa HHB12029]
MGIDGGLAIFSTVRTRRRNGGSGAPNAFATSAFYFYPILPSSYDARSPCDHRTRKTMNSISTGSEYTEGWQIRFYGLSNDLPHWEQRRD